MSTVSVCTLFKSMKAHVLFEDNTVATTALDAGSPPGIMGLVDRGSDPRCEGRVCLFVCGVKGLGLSVDVP